ncbi:uncharacterized protein LOC126693020 [Quercus robur]|uniref:uncharacterized protein LOC126693020 n=1 Tax=Quercus robur TaxID=38942 RepID=UPI002163F6BA|nr:uncharacterized protein LOC126693020 [Quercus robur]
MHIVLHFLQVLNNSRDPMFAGKSCQIPNPTAACFLSQVNHMSLTTIINLIHEAACWSSTERVDVSKILPCLDIQILHFLHSSFKLPDCCGSSTSPQCILQLQALMIHFEIIIDMFHTISMLTSWEQHLNCRSYLLSITDEDQIKLLWIPNVI